MNDESRSDARKRTVAGPSALTIVRLNIAPLVASGLGVALMVISLLNFDDVVSDRIRAVAIGLIASGIGLFCLISLALPIQRGAEVRAGYTTLRTGYPDLDLVDPRSRKVIRYAGELDVSPEEFRRRLAAARASM